MKKDQPLTQTSNASDPVVNIPDEKQPLTHTVRLVTRGTFFTVDEDQYLTPTGKELFKFSDLVCPLLGDCAEAYPTMFVGMGAGALLGILAPSGVFLFTDALSGWTLLRMLIVMGSGVAGSGLGAIAGLAYNSCQYEGGEATPLRPSP